MISTRTFSRVVGTALWLVGAAAPVGAKTVQWTGTLTLDLGRMELSVGTGGGVATLDNSSGGNRLNTLRPSQRRRKDSQDEAGAIAFLKRTAMDAQATAKEIQAAARTRAGGERAARRPG